MLGSAAMLGSASSLNACWLPFCIGPLRPVYPPGAGSFLVMQHLVAVARHLSYGEKLFFSNYLHEPADAVAISILMLRHRSEWTLSHRTLYISEDACCDVGFRCCDVGFRCCSLSPHMCGWMQLRDADLFHVTGGLGKTKNVDACRLSVHRDILRDGNTSPTAAAVAKMVNKCTYHGVQLHARPQYISPPTS